ncbi:MAG: CAP domain-containing protein [Chitinophagaceae bacterium]|nr:CAP domain-containing protein [Chitinophagaceae bacterium]
MRRFLLAFILIIPFLAHSQMASIELVVKPVPLPVTLDTAVIRFNESQTGYNNLSDASKEFYYYINYGRSNPQKFWDSIVKPILRAFPNLKGPEAESLYSDMIRSGSLSMLALNPSLIRTAQLHARDIGGKHAPPSHTSTDGTDFSSRMRNIGIKTCANENIAISSQSTILSVLLLYLDIGLPDKGHRKSLLDGRLKETGIGSAPYGKDQTFFVQDLSCTQ